MEFEQWLSFCLIALVATATPGPAALLVSINSLSYGFKMSLATVLGNITALFIMSLVSVTGLTTLVTVSAFAFNFVKMVGAAYLVYLGIKYWRTDITFEPPRSYKGIRSNVISLYGQGFMVAITNPKAIIFTTALFPQFISITQPLVPQFTLLVISFMTLSFVCLTTYSLLAHKSKSKWRTSRSGKLLGKFFGGTFIGAGCYLASTSK